MIAVLHALVRNGAFPMAAFLGGAPLAGWALKRLMGRGDVRVCR